MPPKRRGATEEEGRLRNPLPLTEEMHRGSHGWSVDRNQEELYLGPVYKYTDAHDCQLTGITNYIQYMLYISSYNNNTSFIMTRLRNTIGKIIKYRYEANTLARKLTTV